MLKKASVQQGHGLLPRSTAVTGAAHPCAPHKVPRLSTHSALSQITAKILGKDLQILKNSI